MHILGPILAQLVTLSVADRTEARHVVSADDKHYEAMTRPALGVGLETRHTTFSVGYTPLITVMPLESKPRDVILFHNGYLNAAYSWGRMELTLSENAGYGNMNFRVLALTNPGTGNPGTVNPGTGNPTGGADAGNSNTGSNGTPNPGTGQSTPGASSGSGAQLRAGYNKIVGFQASITTVGLTYKSSANLSLHGEAGYVWTGGASAEDQVSYPLVKGPRALASANYRLSRSDEMTGTVTGQYSGASTGDSVWLTNATTRWTHHLDEDTTTYLGIGISGWRTSLSNGYITYSIYPAFNGGIFNTSRLGRGTLNLGLGATAAPVIDLVTAAADPRVGLNALVSWKYQRFTTTLLADTTMSTAAKSSPGSLSAVGGALTASYLVGTAVTFDGGVRMAYQYFEGQTLIPISYATFLGLTVALQQRL